MSEPVRARGARPVPTRRAVWLFAAGLVPGLLAIGAPALFWAALAWDVAVALLLVADWALAPRAGTLLVARVVSPILSAGIKNAVELQLEAAAPVRGELADTPAQELPSQGYAQRFALPAGAPFARLTYFVTPATRGDFAFGDVHVRLEGPLGLCARQGRASAGEQVKVYPDLTALTKDALALARLGEEREGRALRRPDEGREFDSLRDYREGDDYRSIDWKATARRARPMVRVHQPERNQTVLLLLDCGRHMTGEVDGRRKLDHAVDAALRVAKVSLDKGDRVGVLAFAREVRLHLPPARGAEALQGLTRALYTVQAALEESDYGAALEAALKRHPRRALVALFTDLLDPETSEALCRRTLALRPRHLPLVISLADPELQDAAEALPDSPREAYARHMAARLVDEHRLTVSRLRNAGALVLRAPASGFGAAAVNEYLRIKARGLL